MQNMPVIITLAYPDGVQVSFDGQGAVVYASSLENGRSFAVTGALTLGDVIQLMSGLMDSFGTEDLWLAMSAALVAKHMEDD